MIYDVNFVYESAGACGYGSQALDLSGGNIAAGVASLFKNGAGCGACFQVCKQITNTMNTQILFINYYCHNQCHVIN